MKPNTCELGLYQLKSLPRGEYVRRVDLCEECKGEGKYRVFGAQYNGETCEHCEGKGYTKAHDKVYIRGEYERGGLAAGKYELIDFNDASRQLMRPGKELVLAGFTF